MPKNIRSKSDNVNQLALNILGVQIGLQQEMQ